MASKRPVWFKMLLRAMQSSDQATKQPLTSKEERFCMHIDNSLKDKNTVKDFNSFQISFQVIANHFIWIFSLPSVFGKHCANCRLQCRSLSSHTNIFFACIKKCIEEQNSKSMTTDFNSFQISFQDIANHFI